MTINLKKLITLKNKNLTNDLIVHIFLKQTFLELKKDSNGFSTP
jgi:hypothetical protein